MSAIEQHRPTSALARTWALAHRAPELSLILALGLAGLGISVYLNIEHYRNVAPVCVVGGAFDCAAVTSSAYSLVPGTTIPITIPGLIWFAVTLASAGYMIYLLTRQQPEPGWLRPASLVWAGVGLVFALYLVYAEIVVLKKLCSWCTVVHLLTLAIFLLALRLWQVGPPEIAPVRAAPRPPTPLAAKATTGTRPAAPQRTPQRTPQARSARRPRRR